MSVLSGEHLASLVSAVALAGVFAVGAGAGGDGIIERVARRRRWVSAAAGVSVAYVFIDILPELATQNQALRQAAAGELLFAEQRIYILALFSFVVMYGIDHIVLSHREKRRESVARGEWDALYRLHVAGFAAYGTLIGYLLAERVERGLGPFAVYTLAMAVHFVVVSHSLAEEHGAVYRRRGRWVLAASVLAGWALGGVLTLSETTFARLFALLAGGVVITSLRAELPDDRNGRFFPFCLGSLAFAGILMIG